MENPNLENLSLKELHELSEQCNGYINELHAKNVISPTYLGDHLIGQATYYKNHITNRIKQLEQEVKNHKVKNDGDGGMIEIMNLMKTLVETMAEATHMQKNMDRYTMDEKLAMMTKLVKALKGVKDDTTKSQFHYKEMDDEEDEDSKHFNNPIIEREPEVPKGAWVDNDIKHVEKKLSELLTEYIKEKPFIGGFVINVHVGNNLATGKKTAEASVFTTINGSSSHL